MKFLVDNDNFDLHIHTTCSDGYDDVDEIIYDSLMKKINCISITDHDNMDGYKEIDIKRLKQKGLSIIPGVEMTCLYHGHRVHVLGYNINPNLFTILKKVFYKHYPNHRHRYISFANAKRLVHLLGGKVILAHPYKYNRDTLVGEELVKMAIEDNLIDGIECFHPYHNEEETKTLLKYADKYDLYVSGGSDYHLVGRKIRDEVKAKGLGYLDVSKTSIKDVINKTKNMNKR